MVDGGKGMKEGREWRIIYGFSEFVKWHGEYWLGKEKCV